MELDELLKEIEEYDPYPKDIFLPRTDAELREACNVLKKAGLVPDGIFAEADRRAIENFKEWINKIVSEQ